jgi:hypothetical protein
VSSIALVGLTGIGASLVSMPGASAAPFIEGDVFVAVSDGLVQQYAPNGTLKDTLVSTESGGFTTGMAFDTSDQLYVTNFGANTVSVLDTDGDFVSSFGSGYSTPESILFDAAGNAYVGNNGGFVSKIDPAGTVIDTFETGAAHWIDLAADQCTMLFTNHATSIFSYDVCTDTTLPNFADGLTGAAHALRIRPDGSVLVANSDSITLLSSAGVVLDSYDQEGQDSWFALNLDPDGTSFWSADFTTSDVFKIDIATGDVLETFNTGTDTITVFGLTVAGEVTVAQSTLDLAPLTASNPVGTNHTLTATATEAGEPAVGRTVTFEVISGPNTGLTRTGVTNSSGVATASYTSTTTGTDTIEASFEDFLENTVTSNQVTKTWTGVGSRTINSSGPLTSITISGDLNCAVTHNGGSEAPNFSAFRGGPACGTFVAVGGTLFGPSTIAGNPTLPRTPFTPISQSAVTGNGSAGNPFRIVTVVALGNTGVRITQTDTYVVGSQFYTTDVQLSKTTAGATNVRVYRAGDCNIHGNNSGLGRVTDPPGSIACLATPSSPNPNRVLEFYPITPGSEYFEATAAQVWARIGTRQAFQSTCRCTENINNAAGLSWTLTVPGAGGGSITASSRINFLQDFVQDALGPGESMQTAAVATSTDPVRSRFTLPAGPGPVINVSLLEGPVGNECLGPCHGQGVLLSPFTGYNDFDNPPILTITWDASLGLTTSNRIFLQKEGPNGPWVRVVPACSSARVSPCIRAQRTVAGGDLEADLIVLDGDPRPMR